MKLAVASLDGVHISPHFGRSRCFLVFELEAGSIVSRSVMENIFTAHTRGECQGDNDHHQHRHGDHADIISALQGCQAVICGGMGRRAAEELRRNGIDAIVVAAEMSPEKAVQDYVSGTLRGDNGFCACHEA
ncbi:NifB/NifX family molybdenum-iron cluster-binding protein [Thermopirellula anaerolimosa]